MSRIVSEILIAKGPEKKIEIKALKLTLHLAMLSRGEIFDLFPPFSVVACRSILDEFMHSMRHCLACFGVAQSDPPRNTKELQIASTEKNNFAKHFIINKFMSV